MNIEVLKAMDTLGIVPKKYDIGGWLKVLGSLNPLLPEGKYDELAKGPFPESRAEITQSLKEYDSKKEKSIRAEIARQAELTALSADMSTIDGDKFMAMDQYKQTEALGKFLEHVLTKLFPFSYPELHPSMIDYLSKNFIVTAQNGKYIYYTRVSQTPNLWEEAPVAPPFENSYGDFRSSVTMLLAINASTEFLQVMAKAKDGDGSPKIFRKIPKWKLFKEKLPDIKLFITGSEKGQECVHKCIDKYIEDSRRRAEGEITSYDFKKGLQDKASLLHELDLAIPDMEWCRRPSVNFATLTNDMNTPAFAYFDLATATPGNTPNFDGLLSGVADECRDAFKAAVYMTVNASCHPIQYIWIHGEGGDGKSSFLAALCTFLGTRLSCSMSSQAFKSDFGLEEAIGKRLIVISDVKTGLSVKSSLIHNITGHDPMAVNRKNRPMITVSFDSIVWIASNSAPDVDFSNPNEARRCLYIKMGKPTDEAAKKRMYFLDKDGNILIGKNGHPQHNGYDLKAALVNEMPHILYKCKEAFDRVCPPPHNAIMQSDAALEVASVNCIDIEADEMEYWLQKTFVFGNPNDRMKQTEIYEAINESRRGSGSYSAYNNMEKRNLRRKLENAHNCKQVKIKGIFYMYGIRVKNDAEVFEENLQNIHPVEHKSGIGGLI